MDCACIGIYRKERLDDSFSVILNKYQTYISKDAGWFSIDLDFHMKPTYTKNERKKLTEVFGSFPEQEINIFGDCDKLFVAAYELIKHFGGLLSVNLSADRDKINSYPGVKIEVQKKKYKYPLNHDPDYWLVDHVFIKEFFGKSNVANFKKYKLAPFLFIA